MIHPDIPAEIPGTELESDFVGPAVQVPSAKPDVIDRASAARVNSFGAMVSYMRPFFGTGYATHCST